ncbi:MAG: signal peptide peptidase SppA [Peptostreptococcaceae bacterium]|nr:signal peptide peptidase SppA [Peptostreptococcaceae bacterium]
MNSKRWIAAGIAAALLTISLLAQTITGGESAYQKQYFLDGLLDEDVMEKVLYQGDSRERIAVIYIDGVISSYTSYGVSGGIGYDHHFVLQQIEDLKNDETVKGLILSVNTPGGGTFESAQLKDALIDLKQSTGIPIYVSMQKIAASGGYYISAHADKIFATEETLTGSIGVIMSGLNLAGLYEKLGITEDTIKSGAFKDIGSSSRVMTEEERAILQEMIDLSYERFVKVVSEGRGISKEKAKKLADGRIYDGGQAKANGLVDEIGYFESALYRMQQDYNLDHAQVFYYHVNRTNFVSLLRMNVSALFKRGESQNRILENLIQAEKMNVVRPMYIYQGGRYE